MSPIVLPPGRHRVLAQPSEYASALMEPAPEGGLEVEGRCRVSLELGNDQYYSTTAEGVAFRFHWLPINATDVGPMSARLRGLLADPPQMASGCYVLQTLLDLSAVGSSVSAKDLLDSLSRQDGKMSCRKLLVACIAQHHAWEPVVLDYYASRLGMGDELAMRDLADAPAIWDSSFLKPLVAQFEQSHWPRMQTALQVLSAHYEAWPAELNLPARLSGRVLAQSSMLRRPMAELTADDLRNRWAHEARELALTHDPDAIKLLRPFLDCQVRLFDLRNSATPLFYPGPALRACDVALEAILALRGEDLGRAYAEVGGEPLWRVEPAGEFECVVDGIRDTMIEELKRQLE